MNLSLIDTMYLGLIFFFAILGLLALAMERALKNMTSQ
jgi:hypothetical protein